MVATLLSNALAFDVPPALVSHRRAQLDGSYTCVYSRSSSVTSPDTLTIRSKNPSYALSLLSELYANRSAPLWKDPASTAWLRKAVATAATMLDDQSNEDVKVGEELFSKGPFPEGYAPAGIIRAAFISGEQFRRTFRPTHMLITRYSQKSPPSALTFRLPPEAAPSTPSTLYLLPDRMSRTTTTRTSPCSTLRLPSDDEVVASYQRGWQAEAEAGVRMSPLRCETD